MMSSLKCATKLMWWRLLIVFFKKRKKGSPPYLAVKMIFQGNHDDQVKKKPMKDPWIVDLGIRFEHGMGADPIEVHNNENDEVQPFMQEEVPNGNLGNLDVIAPCEVDISDLLCINEGKWEVGNHRFSNVLIYDTDNKVEIDCPSLQDTTHNDMPIHTPERDNHCFLIHEEGLSKVTGPIYDTYDDTDKSLTFPCLLQDPESTTTLSISPPLTLSHTITSIEEPLPLF